jgi:Leucine-rich repeat (LRR) protein
MSQHSKIYRLLCDEELEVVLTGLSLLDVLAADETLLCKSVGISSPPNSFEELLHRLPELPHATYIALWMLCRLAKLGSSWAAATEELELRYRGLTHVPESLRELKNLITLNFSNNNISQAPEALGELTKLTKLNLAENNLASLPESIGQLQHLTQLKLDENQLTSLPSSFFSLTKLKLLRLSGNNLSSCPTELSSFLDLGELFLNNNPLLQTLPEAIIAKRNLYLCVKGCNLNEETIALLHRHNHNLTLAIYYIAQTPLADEFDVSYYL